MRSEPREIERIKPSSTRVMGIAFSLAKDSILPKFLRPQMKISQLWASWRKPFLRADLKWEVKKGLIKIMFCGLKFGIKGGIKECFHKENPNIKAFFVFFV